MIIIFLGTVLLRTHRSCPTILPLYLALQRSALVPCGSLLFTPVQKPTGIASLTALLPLSSEISAELTEGVFYYYDCNTHYHLLIAY